MPVYLIEKFVRSRCSFLSFYSARCVAEMGENARIQGREVDVRTSIGTANTTNVEKNAPGPWVHLLAGA